MKNAKSCDMTDSEFSAVLNEAMSVPLTEDELFHWLYSITLAVYDIDSSTYPCSKGSVKRWHDLANIWGRCAESRGEPNLFILAVHLIHWGIYPCNCPTNIPHMMISAIANELLTDCTAFLAWKKNPYFYDAYNFVVKLTYPIGSCAPVQRSQWFLKYIRLRTLLRIIYKNNAPPVIDFIDYSHWEVWSAQKHSAAFSAVRDYEAVIRKLILASSSWTDAQWSDEQFLYKEVYASIGLNVSSCPSAFDALIDFLIAYWGHGKTSISSLLRIRKLPSKSMHLIWPINTRYEISKLFCFAYGHAKATTSFLKERKYLHSFCTLKELKHSWIYRCCKNWVYSGKFNDLAPNTKKFIFEIDANISA